MLGCGLSFRGGAQLAVVRALPAVFFRGGPDKAGQAALVASMVELAALDLRPSLAAVSARTLVACGEKDKPYLADSREIAATIPGAQLRLIPGAGHLWPLQRVDDFVIGEATAERLRREGGTVVGIDWREHSVGVLSLEADLAVEAEVERTFAGIYDEFGRIDVLFNNAGRNDPDDHSVLDMAQETWERVFAANLTTTFLCCRSVVAMI